MNTPNPTIPGESYIDVHKGGVAYVGKDAMKLFRAATLKSGMEMWIKHKMIPTRGCTITHMLAMAKEYTGKTYKRTQAAQAVEDLRVWIETMKTAMPVKDGGSK